MPEPACLDENQIVAYVERSLPPDALTAAERHVSLCEPCRQLAAILRTLHGAVAPPAAEVLPLSGQTLGRFVALGELGRGSMGRVLAAYDPELDRKVALKLVRATAACGIDAGEAESRLQQEARSMARMSHPNVVTVHDVGVIGDDVFVAMELVEGETLREWMARGPRDWHEVVALFAPIGEGLAAAHRAGLVHRDFKPENVLIGRDGRPRITDFGLAVGVKADVARRVDELLARRLANGADVDLTRTGTIMGTPAYMAPEQFQGARVDARADQFAFCVTLHEALFGQRPFAGATFEELSRAVISGQRQPQAAGGNVPAPLRAAIERGLATDPAARHADMESLVAALRLRPRSRRKSLLAGALGLAAVGGALAVVQLASAGPCDRAGAPIDFVWSATTEGGLRAAYTRLAPNSDGVAAVVRRARAYADGWRAARIQVCRATRVESTQSAELMDRRMACLDSGQHQYEATLASMSGAKNADALYTAAEALFELPDVQACAKGSRAAAGPPRPTGAAARGALEALERQLDRLEAQSRLGRYRELAAESADVLSTAEKLAFAPTTTRARLARAAIELELDAHDQARTLLQTAIVDAAKVGDRGLEAQAAAHLMDLVGTRQQHIAEGKELVPFVLAAQARVEEPALHAFLDQKLAGFYRAAGAYRDSLTHAQRAVEILTPLGDAFAPQRARAEIDTGKAQQELGQLDAARASLSAAARTLTSAFGDSHPSVGAAYGELGSTAWRNRDFAAAKTWLGRALDNARRCFGEGSTAEAGTLHTLGTVAFDQEQFDVALDHFQHALRIFAALDANSASVAREYNNIGNVYFRRNDFDHAREYYERALEAKRRRLGEKHPSLASSLINLGMVALQQNDGVTADKRCSEGLAIWEAALPKNHASLTSVLDCLADAQRRQKRYREAIATEERSLSIYAASAASPGNRGAAEWVLAKLLWDSGIDRARAVTVARSARARLVEGGPLFAGHLQELDQRFGRQLRAAR